MSTPAVMCAGLGMLRRGFATLARGSTTLALLAVTAGCRGDSASAEAGPAQPDPVRAALMTLADDSMMGRRIGTPGAEKAARFIAAEMRALGLEPAGNQGFLQTVKVARIVREGRTMLAPILDVSGDTLPADRVLLEENVVGILRGADPALREEAVLVGAHFDHVGVGRAVDGDSIYNGADDDASGVVAVLEVARALRAGPPPKRTVVFVAFTGEEQGGIGSLYYVNNPVVPLEKTVAQLQIEMIGRPDSLAGGTGRAWLTGFERSTVGSMLVADGLPVVADPRPDEQFFLRSDNVIFAYSGVPAHTLSSFGLHSDYHRPSDEVDRVDFAHMTRVIELTVRAVRLLADGPAPTWNAGGRPLPPEGLRTGP